MGIKAGHNSNKATSFVDEYSQVRRFLRIFLLDGNKNIDDFEEYGIKVSTYNQTVAKLKPYLSDCGVNLTRKKGKKVIGLPADMFRFGYNYLSASYAMSSDFKVKKTSRIPLMMQCLNEAEGVLSKDEILNKISLSASVEESSYKRTLEDMEKYGFIDKIVKGRSTKYALRENPFRHITEPDIFLYIISWCRNLVSPYICVNMLMETALKYFKSEKKIGGYETPFIIKGNYFCQLLDDEILWNILTAMRRGLSVNIEYGRSPEKPAEEILPLKIVTDNSSGRRYLFGKSSEKFKMFRLDRIRKSEIGNTRFNRADFDGEYENRTRYSINGVTLLEKDPEEITLKFGAEFESVIAGRFKDCVIDKENLTAVIKVNSAPEIKPWLRQNIGKVRIESDNCGLKNEMAEELEQWEKLYADIQ